MSNLSDTAPRIHRRRTLALVAGSLAILSAATSRAANTPDAIVLHRGPLTVTLGRESARLTVLDTRVGGVLATPPAEQERIRVVASRQISAVEAEWRIAPRLGTGGDFTVRFRLDAGTCMTVTFDRANRTERMSDQAFIPPLVPAEAGAYMAVADYCSGHRYPLEGISWPRTWFDLDRLDMPWFGIIRSSDGSGYTMIAETPDDGWIEARSTQTGFGTQMAPALSWRPSLGTLRYRRSVRLVFQSSGGYVHSAQVYRKHIERLGYAVTLAAKAARNPSIRRLYGAPDVWGDATAEFASEARDLGIRRMLVHGRSSPASVTAINRLGFLTSEYDNYTDVMQVKGGAEVDATHDHIPDAIVLTADGKRMPAWLTFDGKTQYMKRCPTLWVPTAKRVIRAVKASYPYLGRFIDVTTAEALYECTDPAHPLSRSAKRVCGEQLLGAVTDLGLVAGGEHGIWWGVRSQSYIEGMMSGNIFPWPAGHLVHPISRSQRFDMPGGWSLPTWEEFDRWGDGGAYRLPLWELVFHDCVVSTWYWGDASDFIAAADPTAQARKDAWNVLYGTPPLLWASADGSWNKDRRAFLQSYAVTGPLHEQVAGTRMTAHTSLSDDALVQETRFSNGVVAIANFAPDPRRASLRGRSYLLPKYGFVADGAGVSTRRVVVDGTTVTTVSAPGFVYRSVPTGDYTAERVGANRWRVRTLGLPPSVTVPLVPGTAPYSVFAADSQGRPQRRLEATLTKYGVRFTPPAAGGSYTLMSGPEALRPDVDVRLDPVGPQASPYGAPVRLAISLSNHGYRPAGVRLCVYGDQVAPSRLLLTSGRVVSLPDRPRTVTLTVPTRRLEGTHELVVLATTDTPDLCPTDNRATTRVRVILPTGRWESSRWVVVTNGSTPRSLAVLATRIGGPNMAPPSAIRVEDEAGRPLPCQWELGNRSVGGQVVFLVRGAMRAGETRRYRVLWSHKLAVLACVPGRVSRGNVQCPGYSCRISDGHLANIRAGASTDTIIRWLGYSSAATGWTDEPGTVTASRVVVDGPVRTIYRLTKRLAGGLVLERTFLFYDDWFEVWVDGARQGSIPWRSYFGTGGRYRDSSGASALVDGSGDAEGVGNGITTGAWYAVEGHGWTQTCVSLTAASGVAYWDAADWGGIGFTGQGGRAAAAYLIHHSGAATGWPSEEVANMTGSITIVQE